MGTIVIDTEYERCRRILKDSITSKRYAHSIGVSNTAACLAMRYGLDVKKAYLAGLLHDCAKGLAAEELTDIVEKDGKDVRHLTFNPEILHAEAGSIIARDKYGIEDEEILSAIRWHTTGKPDMTFLEKIIFTADYIEPNRTSIPNLHEIRSVAFCDIDEAVMLICQNTLDYLKGGNTRIDRMTVDTYEWYSKKHKQLY